jgi:cation diffusion facilitator CzcD-associated flavoprotein CzcO
MVAPADTGIATRVAGEQVVMKRAVLTAPGGAERVVVQVERLTGYTPLNRHVLHRRFLLGTIRHRLHVTVEREILVQPPAGRAVVDNDIAHGVATQRIVAVLDITPPETQIAQHHVVRIDLCGMTTYANAVPRSALAGNRDERASDA